MVQWVILTLSCIDVIDLIPTDIMNGLLLSTTVDRAGIHVNKRIPISLSLGKKSIFSKKSSSEEWHDQVEFTAGIFRPADAKFPWPLVQKHTDTYIKRKGKLSQPEVDLRLSTLIEDHEARDVAVAACAHLMSPASVRASLNVGLDVAPASFYGLNTYLQCLIAANKANARAISDLEAIWATLLLPNTIPGPGAAKRYLEGVCTILGASAVPHMDIPPDFAILARRAFEEYASQLEGLKLRCQWVLAHSSVAWMAKLQLETQPTGSNGQKLPVALLDTHFPNWRIWSNWRPNLERIKMLDGMPSDRRGILDEMLALEGPDFITGEKPTLRAGLIAQYGAAKPNVSFGTLVFTVPKCTRDELKELLDSLVVALERAINGGDKNFKFFGELTLVRPITVNGLQIIEAVSAIPEIPTCCIHKVVLDIWNSRDSIGGKHITSLLHLITTLDLPEGDILRKTLLKDWLLCGIEKCIQECQKAVRNHIENGLEWTHLAAELHTFLMVVKASNCFKLLRTPLRKHLENLPPADIFQSVIDIHAVAAGEQALDTSPRSKLLKDSIEAYMIDQLIEKGPNSSPSRQILDALLGIWKSGKDIERQKLAIAVCRVPNMTHFFRCCCISQIPQLPMQVVKSLHEHMNTPRIHKDLSCLKLTDILANSNDRDFVQCWKIVLYNIIEEVSDTILEYSLDHLKESEWFHWTLNLHALFLNTIMNSKISPRRILQRQFHQMVEQLSEFIPTLARLQEKVSDNFLSYQSIIIGCPEPVWITNLLPLLRALRVAQEQPAEQLMHGIVGRLTKDFKNAFKISQCIQALLDITPEGFSACERILESHEEKDVPTSVQEVALAGWFLDDDMTEGDKAALKALAVTLDLRAFEDGIPNEYWYLLSSARHYYEEQEKKVLAEADRLDDIKIALKKRDPVGTAILLQQLGVEDVHPLDEEMGTLPPGILDVVERRGENGFEISFPLTSFTDLDRAALGLGTSKTLLVRVFVDYTCEMPAAFCAHMDDDDQSQDIDAVHTPWVCLDDTKDPEAAYCGKVTTAFTWQLNRHLHRHLKVGTITIASLHTFITNNIRALAHSCLICGANHDAPSIRLRRSTPCTLPSCNLLFNTIPIEIRIPELRTDIFAVDLILTTVYAAAMSNRHELLPGCPITTNAGVTAILNALPVLSILRDAMHPSAILRTYHPSAEQLLTWACTHFRGFVTSATGRAKIPGFPRRPSPAHRRRARSGNLHGRRAVDVV
ncbi:hypothetical protein B0J11DRAFT_570954 [Dendryphion nanum]|uniref:Uncharacterized protein n=1 Tax=Dendryphion nanum TaxID=256645 RepID=A0A9P9IFD9_9PLEO|nr:hypothetical protein B0J11DRAFT_570954 [Dendryphion nanum]